MKKLYFDIKKCQACRTCEIACCVGHSQSKELFTAIYEEPISLPRIKIFYSGENFPVSCRHCDEPKCVDACIAKALSKNPETGLVEHDAERCVGCWMCVMVCPYGATRPNFQTKQPVKCDLCVGLVDGPQCLKSCPTKTIFLE